MACRTDTVYLIDADEAVHDALTTLLDANGIRAECYVNAEDFLGSISDRRPMRGVLLLEANVPGMGSLALLRRLRDDGVKVPVVVLTSTSNRDITDQALRAGALEVIEKPLVSKRLLELLCGLVTGSDESVTTTQSGK